MNIFENTRIFFLEEDCLAVFGEEKGKEIYEAAGKLYLELCEKADDRGSEAIMKHMTTNMYPTIAYYKTLRAFGYDEEEALGFVRRETARACDVRGAALAEAAKDPDYYNQYKATVVENTNRDYPEVGWRKEWICCDEKEIHFNMNSCIYSEICTEEGCPELTTTFCTNDDLTFKYMLPRIRFERKGTIGYGDSCCDFHYVKND